MNYRKYTYDSDIYSQKDTLSCGNAIFSFQRTKSNETLEIPLVLKKKKNPYQVKSLPQIIHQKL